MPAILPSDAEVPGLLPQPGSVVWTRASDARLGAMAGYALLLQVAHPTVGAGVAQHSGFQADPWGRLLRTLDYVTATIYGGPQLAAEVGRRVRAIHRRIRGVRPDGERYSALEPEAYAWVHATLADAMIRGHDLLGRPLSEIERERSWAQWRDVGRLVGVRQRDLPEDWAAFRAYVDTTIDEVLRDTLAVHQVLDALARPAAPPVGVPSALWTAVRGPAAWPVLLITTGALPQGLRDRFGIPFPPRRRRAFAALTAASRAASPAFVGPLRTFGPTYLRLRRRYGDSRNGGYASVTMM